MKPNDSTNCLLGFANSPHLRGLLVHGARAVQRYAGKKDDDRSRWLNAVGQRRHRNIATVAQANKTARIAWVVLVRGETYRAKVA